MRINSLRVCNFKKFHDRSFDFPAPHEGRTGQGSFHVLVGKNGSGKTSILDALAIALGVWLEVPPDSLLANSRCRLKSYQKRRLSVSSGDRELPYEAPGDMEIIATGCILDDEIIQWGQKVKAGKKNLNNAHSKTALGKIRSAFQAVIAGQSIHLPVIAYYGAGRTWLPSNNRQSKKAPSNAAASRWEAFYDCLNERIRISDVNTWFRNEAMMRDNQTGRFRSGHAIVVNVLSQVLPGFDGIYFEAALDEVVVSIDGNFQPYSNLSAGQQTLFAMVTDLAIKMVTQNNFLVPRDQSLSGSDSLPRVIAETPGVVLIDELDVHLHPSWQRQIVASLKHAFPRIQFIATTHSPQVIGELQPAEVLLLCDDGTVEQPVQSFGMDSNWILKVLMEADEQDPPIKAEIEGVFKLISERQLSMACEEIVSLRTRIGNTESIQRAASTVERIKLLDPDLNSGS